MQYREVEITWLAIITDAAFVERAVVFQDVGLAQFALAKTKPDARGEIFPAVANYVVVLRGLPHNVIDVRTIPERKVLRTTETCALVTSFGGARHCIVRFKHRLFLVARQAGLIAGVVSARKLTRGSPLREQIRFRRWGLPVEYVPRTASQD